MSLEKERRRVKRSASLKKSNSFKIKRMGNIIVCDCCGQGHVPGKNHLYDYPDNLDDDILCGVCHQPLVDPVDTPCGHTFCYICLKSHLRMQRTCPTDKQSIRERDIKPSSLLVRRILDKLTVVCPNNAYCDLTMARSQLEVHLKYHCAGSYVTCPREEAGCDYMGPRCQLEEHLWSCSYGGDVDKKTGVQVPIVDGLPTTIEIPKGNSDLGLSVSWAEREGGLIVEEIFDEGNAYRDGRLCPGDRIVAVDDDDITGLDLAEATLLLSTPVPLIKLTVVRNGVDIELIELTRSEGSPLGIQIRSSRSRPGIFVYYLVPGSVADDCKLIHPGDRILEANGQDLRHASVDDAANCMSQSSGPLKLLVSHHHRSSNCSDLSLHSGSNLSSSLASSTQPLYDEILAPSGYRIGEPKSILIKKQPDESFGMNVAGGVGGQVGDLPVYISAIRAESAVARSGKIQKGDILLSINGVSLLNKSHMEAIQLIKSVIGLPSVRLELIQGEGSKDPGGLSPDWEKWIKKYETAASSSGPQSPAEYTITLKRDNSESLGFSIVGGVNSSRGNSPIYIRSIAPQSIAATDGRLQSGDELISINGISTISMSQKEAVQIIKKSTGNIILTILPRDAQL